MSIAAYRHSFAHHAWATDRIFDACADLTPEQLQEPVPGTYGSIIEILRHIVQADSFYLWVLTDGRVTQISPTAQMGLDELRAAMASYTAEWTDYLTLDLDPDSAAIEHGDGWEFHAPLGLRLAQVAHHGSDHRSQVCTALTGLGRTPPEIDLWAYGDAFDLQREVTLPSS